MASWDGTFCSGSTYSSLAHHLFPSSISRGHLATWSVGISCACMRVACICPRTSRCQSLRRMLIRCTWSWCPHPSLLEGRTLIWRSSAWSPVPGVGASLRTLTPSAPASSLRMNWSKVASCTWLYVYFLHMACMAKQNLQP